MKKIISPTKVKAMGILGGMGPVSSAHFYSEVLTVCQRDHGAIEDWDYPAIIIYSLPMTGSSGKGFDDTALPQMLSATKKIEAAGADFIVIPCNTAYCFFDPLQSVIKIPILNMIDFVLTEAQKKGWKTLGLVGTEMTVKTGLYRIPAEKKGIRMIDVTAEEQAAILTIIGNVTGGRDTEVDTHNLRTVVEALHSRGAEAVILGCTELPLAIEQSDTTVPLLDSIGILAKGSVDFAYNAS